MQPNPSIRSRRRRPSAASERFDRLFATMPESTMPAFPTAFTMPDDIEPPAPIAQPETERMLDPAPAADPTVGSLVLSRKQNESVEIGDDISVRVIEIRGDKVRLLFKAPKRLKILRHEVKKQIEAAARRAMA